MPKIELCADRNNSCHRVDEFGSSFKYKLSGDKERLGTFFGATITIFMYSILIFYGTMQMHRLVQFGETTVT